MGLIACQYRAAEWRHKEVEPGAGPTGRPGPVQGRFSGLVVRVPGGLGGRHAAGQDRHGRAARAGRDRERAAGLPPLRADAHLAALGGPAGGGRPSAAAAVGLDLGQGPGLPRHPLRHRPGRARRGQHHA
jgi:hypothetical protein